MKKNIIIYIVLIFIILSIMLSACNVNVEDSHYDNVDRTLINPNASEKTQQLMNFIADNYGKYVISGQYINEYEDFSDNKFKADENDPESPMTVFKANELQAVYSVTNKYPAMIGLDISGMEIDCKCYSIEQAIEWDKAGGIVNFCWHWLAPSQSGKRAFYTEQTDFNLRKALKNTDSPEYKGLIADIDTISEQFKILQEHNVPILWRPLHEASGRWFWWGDSGPKYYKKLWDLMYDRMTNYHKLNNLIWVYNGQNSRWYVGDDKCDIIGDDPYYRNNERKYYLKDTANSQRFMKNYKTSQKKIIAMTENDFVPEINAMFNENTKWSMFCTWCRDFVCKYSSDENDEWSTTTPEYNPRCTTAEELQAVYNDERVITLDDLDGGIQNKENSISYSDNQDFFIKKR